MSALFPASLLARQRGRIRQIAGSNRAVGMLDAVCLFNAVPVATLHTVCARGMSVARFTLAILEVRSGLHGRRGHDLNLRLAPLLLDTGRFGGGIFRCVVGSITLGLLRLLSFLGLNCLVHHAGHEALFGVGIGLRNRRRENARLLLDG